MAEKTKPSNTKVSKTEKKTAEKPAVKAVGSKKTTKPSKEVVASSVPAQIEKKEQKVEVAMRKHGDVKVDVFGTDGKVSGTMTLPEVIFAAKVNKQLMAQAVRVYLANQREGSASTKTRTEVEGSSKKLFKQKGTGRARHGSIRASTFVKGGVALGPKPRDYRLDLPKKMKKAAVVSALTSQLMQNGVKVVGDMKNLEMKTKVFASMFTSLAANRKTLVLLAKEEKELTRGMRNISYVDVMNVTDAHTYAVLYHRHIVLTKEAIKELETVYKE